MPLLDAYNSANMDEKQSQCSTKSNTFGKILSRLLPFVQVVVPNDALIIHAQTDET